MIIKKIPYKKIIIIIKTITKKVILNINTHQYYKIRLFKKNNYLNQIVNKSTPNLRFILDLQKSRYSRIFKIKKVIDIKQYLSFNFYGSFNSVLKVSDLIFNLFTHFKLFEHFGFDGNFSQTFFVCFSGVFFTVKLEGYLFGFECL